MNETSERLEFRNLVLSHIGSILKLSLRSDRDSQKLKLYFNAVETLSDVLIPFYDEQMEKESKEFETKVSLIKKENNKKKRELCQMDYANKHERVFNAKMKSAYRNIFRKLNTLLNRNDYLKTSVYGESEDEVVKEDEDDSN